MSKLVGGTGNDVLDGTSSSDTLAGGGGDDRLSGGAGNDWLDGGAGADELRGGDGADIYLFGKGSGRDVIYNQVGGASGAYADKIKLGAGIAPADVTFQRESDFDLVVKIGGTGDRLTIRNYFYKDVVTTSAVETIEFIDGTVWNLAARAQLAVATSGDDRITGTAGAESLGGLDGNDTIWGMEGNDTLGGGSGNDELSGGGGNDILKGDTGHDRLDGGEGADSLFGGIGSDILDGGDGNDWLDGGAGRDTLQGGNGADIYVFGRGYGQDTVVNDDDDAPGTNADKVLLGAGITAADLMLRHADGDLRLAIKGTDDELRIANYFTGDAGTGFTVEKIQFADGTVWDVAAVKARLQVATAADDDIHGYAGADTLNGLDGNDKIGGDAGNDTLGGGDGQDQLYGGGGDDVVNGDANDDFLSGGAGADRLSGGGGRDVLYGDEGDDRLDGGAGADTLQGGSGADTYLFGRGSGEDVIDNYDRDQPGTSADKVLLGAGIAPADVVLYRAESNLVLTIKGTDDRLTIGGYFFNDGNGDSTVETIQFANGTAWDVAAVKLKVVAGSPDADTIVGYAGADTLNGLGGEDRIDGMDGDDTLRGGDLADDLSGGAGNDSLNGDAGNDQLSGGDGTDRLDGGIGNDTLYGGSGADTYVFGRGYGQDVIDNERGDRDEAGTRPDKVLLGAGIATTGVTLQRTQYDDLVVGIKGTDDQLTIKGYFYSKVFGNYAVEAIQFADGTVWDEAAVKARLPVEVAPDAPQIKTGTAEKDNLAGGSGADILDGGAGNDRLDGGAGNDILDGGAGSDIYVFGVGSGQDTIRSYDTTAGKMDVVQLGAGVWATNLKATRDETALVLRITGTGDSLRVDNYFQAEGTGGYQVERIAFADGLSWDVSKVKSLVQQATAERDMLFGYATADTLAGGDGADFIRGNAGKDTLDGGNDDDTLFGDEGNDYLKGGAQDDLIQGGSGDDSLQGEGDDDRLYGDAGNDRLSGGSGDDWLDGGAGNDIYMFGLGSGKDIVASYDPTVGKTDTIEFGAGVLAANVVAARDGDTLVLSVRGTPDALRVNDYFRTDLGGGSRVELIKFADGTSWNVAAVMAKVLAATANRDIIRGYATADTLAGAGGDDVLYGGAGNDTLDGGSGTDRLYGDYGDDILQGGAQDDSLEGGNGSDNLQGQDGNDTLDGADGDDRLDGGAGNDTLNGGDGTDTYLFGRGSGWDTITSYGTRDGELDVILFDKGVLATDVVAASDMFGALVLSIKGTPDVLTVQQYLSDGSNFGAPAEEIRFADGTVWTAADIRAKVLTATQGDAILLGYATPDILTGNYGDDILYGRAGNDTLNGASGTDSLHGGDGDDLLKGGADADTLAGDTGNDDLQGQDGTDELQGGDGDDKLDGGRGDDKLDGGYGNDTYLFGLESGRDTIASFDTTAGKLDTILLGKGILASDVVVMRESFDALALGIKGTANVLRVERFFLGDGNSGHQVERIRFADGTTWDLATIKARALVATAGDDWLTGYATADTLAGGGGNDTLYGLAGNDLLNGGAGADLLFGGAGNDVFAFKTLSDTGTVAGKWDIIGDFVAGQDRIDLSALDANAATTANDAFTGFVGAFTQAGQLRFAGGVLYGNTDADVDAEFAIALTGVTTLTAKDIVL